MRFATPLIPATLIRRYKRFLADVLLEDGPTVVAHCPNPGAMTGQADPGARIWLEPNDDPRKKLDYGWRLTELGGGHFCCVDTGGANRTVEAALRAGAVPGLDVSGGLRAEVPYADGSRVDFVLGGEVFVEVKAVSLSRAPGLAEFSDTRTARGARHMDDLAGVVAGGRRAVVLFLVQRTDCDRVGVAADIDPVYAAAVARARDAGVEVMALGTKIDTVGVTATGRLPVELPPLSS